MPPTITASLTLHDDKSSQVSRKNGYVSPRLTPPLQPCLHLHSSKMKVAICLLALVAVAVAAPQERDGAALTNEAIRQAQSQQLIPRDATIQGVQEGIQVAAIESIPGDQRVDLFQLLGDQVPREVITNLQSQVDQVGHA